MLFRSFSLFICAASYSASDIYSIGFSIGLDSVVVDEPLGLSLFACAANYSANDICSTGFCTGFASAVSPLGLSLFAYAANYSANDIYPPAAGGLNSISSSSKEACETSRSSAILTGKARVSASP